MDSMQPLVLVISHDEMRCAAVCRELEQTTTPCRVTYAASFASARQMLSGASPDVIVLEESALESSASAERRPPLADAVSVFAGFAPVIVLGVCAQPVGLSALIAAGAAEFVAPGTGSFRCAAALVERKVNAMRRLTTAGFDVDHRRRMPAVLSDQTFGEILRHELNNPLTGILGNAELLLAEARRKNRQAAPEAVVTRLETIAALAVRMRETVRRLSQSFEPPVESELSSRLAVPQKR